MTRQADGTRQMTGTRRIGANITGAVVSTVSWPGLARPPTTGGADGTRQADGPARSGSAMMSGAVPLKRRYMYQDKACLQEDLVAQTVPSRSWPGVSRPSALHRPVRGLKQATTWMAGT